MNKEVKNVVTASNESSREREKERLLSSLITFFTSLSIPIHGTIVEKESKRKSIILLEGSQATPARPSGRNKVKVKTLW
jgi:hypothetical protein